MSFTRKKHPALPQDESGWFLYHANETVNKGKRTAPVWKAGYHGKEHPHAWKNHNTEQEAIAWVEELHAEHQRNAQIGDVMQRFLMMPLRVAA